MVIVKEGSQLSHPPRSTEDKRGKSAVVTGAH